MDKLSVEDVILHDAMDQCAGIEEDDTDDYTEEDFEH